MARSRSVTAPALFILAALSFLCHLQASTFMPAPLEHRTAYDLAKQSSDVAKVGLFSVLVASQPVLAVTESVSPAVPEDAQFDFRIFGVLAPVLIGVSWAVFNIVRVASSPVENQLESLEPASK